jgi:hypothetical protein
MKTHAVCHVCGTITGLEAKTYNFISKARSSDGGTLKSKTVGTPHQCIVSWLLAYHTDDNKTGTGPPPPGSGVCICKDLSMLCTAATHGPSTQAPDITYVGLVPVVIVDMHETLMSFFDTRELFAGLHVTDPSIYDRCPELAFLDDVLSPLSSIPFLYREVTLSI